jgi:hypothetical protein
MYDCCGNETGKEIYLYMVSILTEDNNVVKDDQLSAGENALEASIRVALCEEDLIKEARKFNKILLRSSRLVKEKTEKSEIIKTDIDLEIVESNYTQHHLDTFGVNAGKR